MNQRSISKKLQIGATNITKDIGCNKEKVMH